MEAHIIDITDKLDAFTKSREKVDVKCIDGNLVVWRGIARELPNYIDDEDGYVEIYDRFVDEVKTMIVDIRDSKKNGNSDRKNISKHNDHTNEVEESLKRGYSITKEYLYKNDNELNQYNEINYLSNFFKRVGNVCVCHYSILEGMNPSKCPLEKSNDKINNKLLDILIQDEKLIFPLIGADIILGCVIESEEENICSLFIEHELKTIPITVGKKFYPLFIPLSKISDKKSSFISFEKRIKSLEYRTYNFSSEKIAQKFKDANLMVYDRFRNDNDYMVVTYCDNMILRDMDKPEIVSLVRKGDEVYLKKIRDVKYHTSLPGYFDPN